MLRAGRPTVCFCHLAVDPVVVEERMALRTGHFMPPSLLPSQLATLEPLAADEPGITVAAEAAPEDVVAEVVRRLGLAVRGRRGSAGPALPVSLSALGDGPGRIAQLVERLPYKEDVRGSSPFAPTPPMAAGWARTHRAPTGSGTWSLRRRRR